MSANPKHYKNHKISPIHLIEDYNLGFARGNVIKYVARAHEKNGREDLVKALWYLVYELAEGDAANKVALAMQITKDFEPQEVKE